MTKKDFERIAHLLGSAMQSADNVSSDFRRGVELATRRIGLFCQEKNPRFDADKFYGKVFDHANTGS